MRHPRLPRRPHHARVKLLISLPTSRGLAPRRAVPPASGSAEARRLSHLLSSAGPLVLVLVVLTPLTTFLFLVILALLSFLTLLILGVVPPVLRGHYLKAFILFPSQCTPLHPRRKRLVISTCWRTLMHGLRAIAVRALSIACPLAHWSLSAPHATQIVCRALSSLGCS